MMITSGSPQKTEIMMERHTEGGGELNVSAAASRERERKKEWAQPGWREARGGAQRSEDKKTPSGAWKKTPPNRSPVSSVGADRCAAKGQRSSNRWRDGSTDCGPGGGIVCLHSTRCCHTATCSNMCTRATPPPPHHLAKSCVSTLSLLSCW